MIFTKPEQTFDYYVRSITTSVLALSILAAAIYALVHHSGNADTLVGWAGMVVGVYFGSHSTLKGVQLGANGTLHNTGQDGSRAPVKSEE